MNVTKLAKKVHFPFSLTEFIKNLTEIPVIYNRMKEKMFLFVNEMLQTAV